MTGREKLIELLSDAPFGVNKQTLKSYLIPEAMADVADHLIANGATVQKHGWIKVYHGAMYPYSCSECGNCHARRVSFCERCGTKLDLPEPPKGE